VQDRTAGDAVMSSRPMQENQGQTTALCAQLKVNAVVITHIEPADLMGFQGRVQPIWQASLVHPHDASPITAQVRPPAWPIRADAPKPRSSLKIVGLFCVFSRCRKASTQRTLVWCWWVPYRHLLPRFAERATRRNCMTWEKPAASDMRFGFEITMYIANR